MADKPRAPGPGERIVWEPVKPSTPTQKPATTATAAPAATTPPHMAPLTPTEQAQLHIQRVRLAEGKSAAEIGEGFVPVGQAANDAEAQRYINEQRERFPRESKED